jgi:hypothetical protein
MANVIYGNHSSVLVPRKDQENIRKFYCDLLGGKITKEDPERTSFVWEKTSISDFFMGMFPMRANSYELRGRFGWKSNQTMWNK